MEVLEMNPLVRYINIVPSPQRYPEPVLAYDFRMLYMVRGSLCVEMQDNSFVLCPGDLFVLPPATAYQLEFERTAEVRYYILNFDFAGNWKKTLPHPPEGRAAFVHEKVFSLACPEKFSSAFLLHHALFAEELLSQIYQTHDDKAMQSALMKQLLVRAAKGKALPENEIVHRIKGYIHLHYAEEINNETVAKYFGYHPYYLNTAFLKSEGITLHKYIEKIRMLCAGELLGQTEKSIAEIAENCGFKDASYFCKFFVRHMKMTPKQYRKLVK